MLTRFGAEFMTVAHAVPGLLHARLAGAAPPEPVIPLAVTLTGGFVIVVYAALIVVAVITLVRAEYLSRGEKIVWTFVIVLLPLVGSVAWLSLHLLRPRTRSVSG